MKLKEAFNEVDKLDLRIEDYIKVIKIINEYGDFTVSFKLRKINI
mgnify:CR=1 FL=1